MIRVKRKLNSTDVVDALTGLFILRGPRKFIRSDNGAEFIAEKVRAWIAAEGAKIAFIEPGSLWWNGCCESFNARHRDELLNGEVFCSLREAQILIEKWRRPYVTLRPAQRLGLPPPSAGNHRPNGPEAEHALTFNPDHSVGAVHRHETALVDGSGLASGLDRPGQQREPSVDSDGCGPDAASSSQPRTSHLCSACPFELDLSPASC